MKTFEFFDEIKNHDISSLWTSDSIEIENEGRIIKRPQSIGYIGGNYQRFHIRFISAIQNPNNSYEYLIYGKTKVNDNVCSFQGRIGISESRIYAEGDIPSIKQGYVKGYYEFFEDPNNKGSGILTGTFKTNFFIENNGEIKYDALMFVADGYDNNQFEGTWISYVNPKSKKCNWGDFRIPDSRGLDIGAGEFSPWDKFDNYGWENYNLGHEYSSNTPEAIAARKKENEEWWLE